MNESERNRMIDKIRKVMALSNNPNENEAAAAAAKAQAMLAEYNLTLGDISEESKDEDQAVFIEDDEETSESVPWRRQIAVNVANLYFCEYFYTMVYNPTTTRSCGYIRKDRHTFIGAQHNVVVAKMMFKYLSDTVERLADDGARKVTAGERSPYRTSFKMACTLRLCARLRERKAAAIFGGIKSETTGKNLPALMDLYSKTKQQLEKYVAEKHKVKKSKMRGGRMAHPDGVADGRRAGDSISLDQQISGQADHRLLK